MSESGKNVVVTYEVFDNSIANSFGTENAGEKVYKRPRGRPKLAKGSLELSGTLSSSYDDIKCRDESSSNLGHLRKRGKSDSSTTECIEESNIVAKRPRGRPKLAKARPEIIRRGRGRPKGSLNRNIAHGLNLLSRGMEKKIADRLSEISKGGLPPSSSENNGTTTYGNGDVCALPNNSSLYDQSFTVNAKRRRGRPPGAKNKKKTFKLIPKSAKTSLHQGKGKAYILRKGKSLKNTNTKSKQVYQPANVRDIPKHRFDESMEMITNKEHPIWEDRNTSCSKSIHRHWDSYGTIPSDHNLRLKFARQFLVRRDWMNLCKALSISLQDVVTHCNSYYSLFTKYASICLAHTDKEQFNKFVQFLLKTEDGGKVLQKCTQFSQNCSDDEDE